jgi:hypothetical protein
MPPEEREILGDLGIERDTEPLLSSEPWNWYPLPLKEEEK